MITGEWRDSAMRGRMHMCATGLLIKPVMKSAVKTIIQELNTYFWTAKL